MNASEISGLRKDYQSQTLEIKTVALSPIEQFGRWFSEALDTKLLEPNAMVLATADAHSKPSARTLLLKGFDEKGFVFFTNYESQKGRELSENPQAEMLFLWLELERQVRIGGTVERVSAQESTDYFQSRPKGSQIGAHASPQSKVISDRSVLDEKVAFLLETYRKSTVLPRPEHWGGYRLHPTMIEFWQGRSNRLHDRIRYLLQLDGTWLIERLAP